MQPALPAMMSRMRKLLVAGVASVLVFFAVLAQAGSAGAVGSSIERIVQYDVDVTVNDDGSALFRELIVYDFGPNARHGIDRVLPTLMGYDDTSDRSYPLTVVTVAAVDASARYSVSDVGSGRTRIRIGDADRTITGSHAYTITYRLDGVVNAQPGDDELYWNVIGDAWSVAIDRAEVRVHVPGGATRVACYVGATRSSATCDLARVDPPADPRIGSIAVFAHEALFSGEGITVAVAMPDTNGDTLEPQPILVAKSLHEARSLRDRFALTALSGGLAAGLTVVFAAAIARLQFLVGRDRRTSGSATDAAFSDQIVHGERVPLHDTTAIPVEFVPPDKLRPAQLGVLRDEVANTHDVSATIVDLAVRGFLRIEEITDGTSITDYKLVALRGDERGELLEYERYLIGQIFEKSPEVTLSTLKNKFASAMARTKTLLYENAMANGWFSARPDHVRTIWSLAGFVVLAFSHGGHVPHRSRVALRAGRGAGGGGRSGDHVRCAMDAPAHAEGNRRRSPSTRLRGLHPELRKAPCSVRGAHQHLHRVPAVRGRPRCDPEMGQHAFGTRPGGTRNVDVVRRPRCGGVGHLRRSHEHLHLDHGIDAHLHPRQ